MTNFIPPANGASLGSYIVKMYFFVKKGEYFCGLAPYENYIAALVLTPCMGVCGFFLHVKFATSLLALLAGGLAK